MTTTETAPRAAGRYDWVAPVISTLLTLPAAVIAWFAATFSVYALPWEPRNREKRVLFAVLAPLSVVLLYLAFAGLVDWPS